MNSRITFLDWMRCIACLMVMLVHACEYYYLNADGFHVETASDAFWVSAIDTICRAAVPLFVITSSFLLFPVSRPTGEFFRRRLMRVLLPGLVWMCVYCAVYGGWERLPFNFPDAGGHIWFVPMIIGVYLLMPLLSPWAEKVSKRELQWWIILWLFTTTFPFIRKLWEVLFGAPSFGAIPYLWGECPWNDYGTFYYVSGFFGYLLLGLWFRRYLPTISRRKIIAIALPLLIVGYLIAAVIFYLRIPRDQFPVTLPYGFAVDLEMSWMFCSTGIALTVIGWFMLISLIKSEGWFYRHIIQPASRVSYGTYLMHMLILTPVVTYLAQSLPTPLTILLTALITLVTATLISTLLSKIPYLRRLV